MEPAVEEKENTVENGSNPPDGYVEEIVIRVLAVYASSEEIKARLNDESYQSVIVRIVDVDEEEVEQESKYTCIKNDEFNISTKTNCGDFYEQDCTIKRTWEEFGQLFEQFKQHSGALPAQDAKKRIKFIEDCLIRWSKIDECRRNSLFYLFLSSKKFDINFRDSKMEDEHNVEIAVKIFKNLNDIGWIKFTKVADETGLSLADYVHKVLFISIEHQLKDLNEKQKKEIKENHQKRAKSVVDLIWRKKSYTQIQIRPVIMFVKFTKVAQMTPLFAFLVRPEEESDFIVDVNFTESARKYHDFARFRKHFVMPWQEPIKLFYQQCQLCQKDEANRIVRLQLDKDGLAAIEQRKVSFFSSKLVQRTSTTVGIVSLVGSLLLMAPPALLPAFMSASAVTGGTSLVVQGARVFTTVFGSFKASRFFYDRKVHGQHLNWSCAESRMHALQIAAAIFAAGGFARTAAFAFKKGSFLPNFAKIDIMAAEGRIEEITKLDRLVNNTAEMIDLAFNTCTLANSQVPRLMKLYKDPSIIANEFESFKNQPLAEKLETAFFFGVDTASTSISIYGFYLHCRHFEFADQMIRRIQDDSLAVYRQNVDGYMEKVTEFWTEEKPLCQVPVVAGDSDPINAAQNEKTNLLLEAGSKAIRLECRDRCAYDRPEVLMAYDQKLAGCIMANGEELGRNSVLKAINGLKVTNESGSVVISDWQPLFDGHQPFFVLKDVKHQWNVVGADIQAIRLLENDRIYMGAIEGARANRFSMPGTKSTKRDGKPIELKEVSEQLTVEGIIPTLELQRDAIKEVCTSSQKECGDNIDQQNFVFTLMIGHLDTDEFHKNENDFLFKTDRERMESVAGAAHENLLKASGKAKQQIPFEQITKDVSVAHGDELFGKVATLHMAREAANNEAAASCLAMAGQKGLENKWPDTRYSDYSKPRKNESYAWDPRDLTYNYTVVYGTSSVDCRGKCGTLDAFAIKDFYYEERNWWFWDKTVRSNTDWLHKSADFTACKYRNSSGHIQSKYFDASMLFDMVFKNVFTTVLNPVAGVTGFIADVMLDLASVSMREDDFRIFKMFLSTTRNLFCGLADGFDPKQFVIDTGVDGFVLLNPQLEVFTLACKGLSDAAFALKAGESAIKAIQCVGTGFGNAIGRPEIGLITGVACGLADYKATANSHALIQAADNVSATLLGTPSGMFVVGNMAVSAIRSEINHHNLRQTDTHGIGEADSETILFALPHFDDNLEPFEVFESNFDEPATKQKYAQMLEADLSVCTLPNDQESGSNYYFNDHGGEFDWESKYDNSDWYYGQNDNGNQKAGTSAAADDSGGRGVAHILVDATSDTNVRFRLTRFHKNPDQTVFAIYDRFNKMWILRVDPAHAKSGQGPHINLNTKYLPIKRDPHTPIREWQLKMSKMLGKGAFNAGVILNVTSIGLDARHIYDDCKNGNVKKCLSTTCSILAARSAGIVLASEATTTCMKLGGPPFGCLALGACAAVASELGFEKVVKKIFEIKSDEKK